jgi:putative transposase
MSEGEMLIAQRISNGVPRGLDSEYRHAILNPGVRAYIARLYPKVLRDMPGCEVIEVNMQPDHIHMLILIPPKYAVSE